MKTSACYSMERKFRVKRVLLIGVCGLLFAHIPGQKVNDNAVFELDGDAIVNKGAGGHDWVTVNPPGSAPDKGTLGFQARAFIADGTAGQTIFTTGGSKDDLDISSWVHTNGSVPDKDEIVNAYAAAYSKCDSGSPANCDLLIYFGLDRYDNNGDANAGFWFNQAGGVTDPNVAGKFTGKHKDHDILVLSTFTGGGQVSTIEILEWNPTYCQGAGASDPTCNVTSNRTLRKLFPTGTVAAQCDTTNNPDACGISNSGTINVDWDYDAKGGGIQQGVVPKASFFEGGINLTHILATAGVTDIPCITSFLAETRSSSSEDAVLKDFAAGSFPVCGLAIAKECSCTIATGGTSFAYPVSGTVTNTGFSSVYNVEVTDDAGTPGNTSDDLTFSLGTVAAGATVNWGGTESTFTSLLNPATNTAKVVGTADAAGLSKLPAVDTGLKTCQPCTVNNSMDLTKTCTAGPYQASTGSPVVIQVQYSGSVTNNGTVALTDVTVSEDHDANGNGTPDILSLPLFKTVSGNPVACGSPCQLAVGETATFSGTYFPSVLNVVPEGRALFQDIVAASGKNVLPSPNTNPPVYATVTAGPKPATCALCPPGSAACPQ